MSDTSPFGFGRFVPGFDFLQSLAKGAGAGLPGMAGWVAPTATVQDLDKRIQDLKAVQFWLEQNVRGVSAMVQALEVQKMTLATLQGMNVAMGDMASAFGAAAQGAAAPEGTPAAAPPAAAPHAAAPPETGAGQPQGKPGDAAGEGAAPQADPLQWWGSLTSQFQQIAARAMQDAASHQAAFEATRDMASGALKTASDMASQWAQGVPGAGPAPADAADAPADAAPRAARTASARPRTAVARSAPPAPAKTPPAGRKRAQK
ncbi:PhaM family polyhydroxyalkanoate granule multifunctional regulatory protein [Melaminivora sp.]|uniref:PhaM family polyhydroxyalkanoate granule multifunctional regulatory protein n=1 Tax=Melaminivora sp. TaxID=1933032 RepID=UPI0028A7567D|nr:PhaM family polyhydroxyalkanoate granule multifunctional regulatory protein [Melaminivora sp.]